MQPHRSTLYRLLPMVIVLLLSLGPAAGYARDTAGSRAPTAAPGNGAFIVENVGQFDPRVRFQLRWGSSVVWVTDGALWITLFDEEKLALASEQQPPLRQTRAPAGGVHLKLGFVGANAAAAIEPFDRLSTRVSYLIGNDPEAWQAAVPVYGGLRIQDLYPGLDLVLATTGAQDRAALLPWRLETGPGADLDAVQLRLEGAASVVAHGSALVLETSIGALALDLPPVSGQTLPAGEPPAVQRLADSSFLVTAPISGPTTQAPASPSDAADLLYSTFLGGAFRDEGTDLAVDAEGAAYLAGWTPSPDFPVVPGSFDTTINGRDAFVAKLAPAGNGPDDLIYATFLGGIYLDQGTGIAVAHGQAFVTGETRSVDFPTTEGAFDPLYGRDGKDDDYADAFVAQLNADGTQLLYGSYLGGSDVDKGTDIATAENTVYVTGETSSDDLTTTRNAFDRDCGTDGKCNPEGPVPRLDGFLVRLSPGGQGSNDLLYGTFLGGSSDERATAIAVSGGDAFLTGWTTSADFPGTGHAGGGDAFAVRIQPAGAGSDDLVYGTLLGGTGLDVGNGIAVSGHSAYVTGSTQSGDFPVTEGAFAGGLADAFLARLDGDGALTYATYLGGAGIDLGLGAGVDQSGAVILTGRTASSGFPVTENGYDLTHNGGDDLFVSRLDLNSTLPQHLTYSTFLGGSDDEAGNRVAVDELGTAYLTGGTASPGFPTSPGAFDTELSGTGDGFLVALQVSQPSAISLEKRTNGLDADEPPGPYLVPGEAVAWDYVVTNRGQQVLENIQVHDDLLGEIECPQSALEPWTTMTCTTVYGTAEEGQYANLGTATGRSPGVEDPATDTDPSHYYGAVPGVGISKRAAGHDADVPPGPLVRAGEMVTFTYVITNTGNVTLRPIEVTDDQDLFVDCPFGGLAPNQSMTCVATDRAVTGPYANTATVTGTPPSGLEPAVNWDASHYFGADPRLTLEKRTNGQDADTPPGPFVLAGEMVTWTYTVANDGNVALDEIAVSDDQGVPVSCPDDGLDVGLDVGASMTCSATGTAIQGPYANTGTATARAPVGPAVTAQDESHYLGVQPEVELQKLTNGHDADQWPGPLIEEGEDVTWTYIVSNTGDITLTQVSVTDDQGLEVSCVQTTIAPGEAIACSASAAAVVGQYANLGTVIAQPAAGLPPVSARDPSHYVGYGSEPAIQVQKLTEGQDADTPPGPYLLVGGTVQWAYLVSNTGNRALQDVEVTDDKVASIHCPQSTLSSGESMSCTALGEVRSGQHQNEARVSATVVASTTAVSDTDLSHYFGADPMVELEKRTNGHDVMAPPGPEIVAGEAVTWTYRVRNAGNVPLSDLVVSDDNGSPSSDTDALEVCRLDMLDVDASQTCTLVGIASLEQYGNTGLVEAYFQDTRFVAEDRSYYFGVEPETYVYLPLIAR